MYIQLIFKRPKCVTVVVNMPELRPKTLVYGDKYGETDKPDNVLFVVKVEFINIFYFCF